MGTGARTEGPFPVKELVRQWLKAGYVEEVNGNNSTLAIERVGNLCYDVTGAGRWPLSSQRGRTEMAVADEFLQANDQYVATLPSLPAGVSYFLRFRLNNGPWCYADNDGNGANVELNGFSFTDSAKTLFFFALCICVCALNPENRNGKL